MSIKRGANWGERAEKPSDLVYANSDRAAADVIAAARRANSAIPRIGLTGGDLHRTLGGSDRSALESAPEATHVTVDLGEALLDGKLHWFVAHLVARKAWLRGRILIAANAAFIGSWNIAPRAHPGDGRLDLLDADLSVGDRLKARSRLRSGAHIPHPEITVRRTSAAQFDFAEPIPIHLDGHRQVRATKLSVRLEPEALDIWI